MSRSRPPEAGSIPIPTLADRRRGFVQIVPSALAALAQRYSPTATALLTRLLIQADPRTPTVRGTTATALARGLALGWQCLVHLRDEGLVR